MFGNIYVINSIKSRIRLQGVRYWSVIHHHKNGTLIYKTTIIRSPVLQISCLWDLMTPKRKRKQQPNHTTSRCFQNALHTCDKIMGKSFNKAWRGTIHAYLAHMSLHKFIFVTNYPYKLSLQMVAIGLYTKHQCTLRKVKGWHIYLCL